jgi:hypothetical protein
MTGPDFQTISLQEVHSRIATKATGVLPDLLTRLISSKLQEIPVFTQDDLNNLSTPFGFRDKQNNEVGVGWTEGSPDISPGLVAVLLKSPRLQKLLPGDLPWGMSPSHLIVKNGPTTKVGSGLLEGNSDGVPVCIFTGEKGQELSTFGPFNSAFTPYQTLLNVFMGNAIQIGTAYLGDKELSLRQMPPMPARSIL